MEVSLLKMLQENVFTIFYIFFRCTCISYKIGNPLEWGTRIHYSEFSLNKLQINAAYK